LHRVVKDESVPPASRISAVTALLDRGWGRPFQAVGVAVGGPDALARLLEDIAQTRPAVAGQLPQVIDHQPLDRTFGQDEC